MIGKPHYIKLVRVLFAPPARVFCAWTDPAQLRLWFSPRGFEIEEYVGNVRPGDAWRIRMRSPQGTEYLSGGTCRELVAPAKLIYTHSWDDENEVRSPETTVSVEFAEFHGNTLLTFHQEVFPSAESRDSHEAGWCTCLEKLAEVLQESAK